MNSPVYYGSAHLWDLGMSLLETSQIVCPYCGKCVEIVVDCSIDIQEYIEDCHICCRPISLSVSVINGGEPSIKGRREDE